MELRLNTKGGDSLGLEQREDSIWLTLSLPRSITASGWVVRLTDQEAETLARELFALTGRS